MVAFDVLRGVDNDDAYANLLLPPMLRRRNIRGRDAGFATELTYGTLRLKGRYDAILAHCTERDIEEMDGELLDVLRLGAHQLLGMRVPAHAACSETVGLARARIGSGPAQLANAVLRRVSEKSLEEWLDILTANAPDAITGIAQVESHPVWIARAFREALAADGRNPEEVRDLLAADNVPPRVTLVARPGLSNPAELPGEPGGLAPTAVIMSGGDPLAVPAVEEGRAGVQDEGSQLVAWALAAASVDGRDTHWLDLCAGPGGKSALLGAIAARSGATLVANEVQPHRAALVEKAIRAVPDGVVTVRTGDGRDMGTIEPGAYDRVLVDAPCTGLGALRRRPESRWRRTPADLTVLTGLQRELLGSAIRATRTGGVIGYVTCSPHLAETRFVVQDVTRALAKKEGITTEVMDAIQLWPHVHGTDAMHLTLLRRT
jgi:16S rRNA (cytosine967-C5)-methyltransferase